MSSNPNNPYLGNEETRLPEPYDSPYVEPRGAGPELADTSPQLRQAESQRVNRKAMMFLAGIVGLLVLMAMWAFTRAADDDARKAIRPSGETVRIPELPQAAAEPRIAASVAPIPLAGDATYAAQPAELPPLPEQSVQYDMPPPPPPPPFGGAAPVREPSLLERRMGATAGGAGRGDQRYQDVLAANLQAFNPNAKPATPVEEAPKVKARAKRLFRPDTLMVRGTFIRCVLETRIVTEVEGFTACVVTEPVYSINGRSLLLPKGSKVLGRYKDNPRGERVEVMWDRITTPNGLDMNMASPGVDALGGAGVPGDRDERWAARITSALLISLISDGFAYAAAENGPVTRFYDGNVVFERPFESRTARAMENLAQQAAEQYARRPATVTVPQGTVVNVYVAQDIDFSNVIAQR